MNVDQENGLPSQTRQTRSVRYGRSSVIFNESVMFLVCVAPDTALQNCQILIQVVNCEPNVVLGSLKIGSKSQHKVMIDLWRDVCNNQSKSFKISHILDSASL